MASTIPKALYGDPAKSVVSALDSLCVQFIMPYALDSAFLLLVGASLCPPSPSGVRE